MRLALLADLHFGTVPSDLAKALLAALARERPDAVLIAGDFVQRARPAQFHLACRFLEALPAPWHAVPGNHDLPLYNLPARVVEPRAAYRRWIAPETEFEREIGDVSLIGLDTTTRWRHQRGWVTDRQIAHVSTALSRREQTPPVILAHHPFCQGPDASKQTTLGAQRALAEWSGCQPHLLLTGHLHAFRVAPFFTRRVVTGRTLQVQCGTSASCRRRGSRNGFAMIEVNGRDIQIHRHEYVEGAGFNRAHTYQYFAASAGWEER